MKPIIIANWKMNPSSLRQAQTLFSAVDKAVKQGVAKVIVCPPSLYLASLHQMRKRIVLGAQDCSWEREGALTGEISPLQLKNIGCGYVILGHSERKKYVGETLGMTQAKLEAAQKVGLRVVLCVESLSELSMIKKKTKSFKNVLVVFEPSSAISTQGGKRITPKNIVTMVRAMKKITGRNTPILYGGSVDSKSISEIMNKGRVQGVLVGAASLESREFTRLVKNAVFR